MVGVAYFIALFRLRARSNPPLTIARARRTAAGAASGACQVFNANTEYGVYVFCGGLGKNSTYEYQKLPKKGDCSSALETSTDTGALVLPTARRFIGRAYMYKRLLRQYVTRTDMYATRHTSVLSFCVCRSIQDLCHSKHV